MKRKSYLTVGGRLLLASIVLLLGVLTGFKLPALIVGGIVMTFPGFKFHRGRLAIGTTEDEKKKFFEEITGTINKLIKESQKDDPNVAKVDKFVKDVNDRIQKLSDEEIKAIKAQFDKLSKDYDNVVEENKKINKALSDQSDVLKKLTDKAPDPASNKDRVISLREALKQAIMARKDQLLKEVKDSDTPEGRLSMSDYLRENHKTPVMTVKALVDMFVSNIAQPSVPDLRLTELDPTRVSIPLSVFTHVMNVFSSRPISKPYMALLVVYEYEDGAGVKAEGVASVKSSFKLKTIKFPAFYIATHYVLSDETMDDLDEVLDEIAYVAPDKIMEAIDEQIIRTGGDDVASIKGILHADKSTPYARQIEEAIDAPYIVDLIQDAILQAEYGGYLPNVVQLNPKQIAALSAKKNNMNDSLSDRRVQYGANGTPTYVCGLLISKVKEQPANTCLVYDNKQPWIGKRKELQFEIGYSGTQFVEGEKTAKISVRIAFGVRDKAGVIYVSDIAAGIAALANPV